MAYDTQQLLVRPNIMGQGGDVEIAKDDDFIIFLGGFGPLGHVLDEAELEIIGGVFHSIGNIATGGDVEIMQLRAVRQERGNVALMVGLRQFHRMHFRKGNFGEDGNAVVTFLAAEIKVWVAEGFYVFYGEGAVFHFGFLKADDVGIMLFHQPF